MAVEEDSPGPDLASALTDRDSVSSCNKWRSHLSSRGVGRMAVYKGHYWAQEETFFNPLTNEELEDSGVLFQDYSGRFCKHLGTRDKSK